MLSQPASQPASLPPVDAPGPVRSEDAGPHLSAARGNCVAAPPLRSTVTLRPLASDTAALNEVV